MNLIRNSPRFSRDSVEIKSRYHEIRYGPPLLGASAEPVQSLSTSALSLPPRRSSTPAWVLSRAARRQLPVLQTPPTVGLTGIIWKNCMRTTPQRRRTRPLSMCVHITQGRLPALRGGCHMVPLSDRQNTDIVGDTLMYLRIPEKR